MLIRQGRDDEFEAIGALTVAAYEALEGSSVGDYALALADVASRAAQGVVLVAVEGDDVVGSVTFVPGPGTTMSEFTEDDACGIRMLAVAPRHEGRGAGRALTEACIARGREQGCGRVLLHSTRAMVVARGLYERLGFRRDEARDVVLDGHVDVDGSPFRLLAYELVL